MTPPPRPASVSRLAPHAGSPEADLGVGAIGGTGVDRGAVLPEPPLPKLPPVYAKYLERHAIRAERDWDEDSGRFVYRCRHDGIRLVDWYGQWVHDEGAVIGLKTLAQLELAYRP